MAIFAVQNRIPVEMANQAMREGTRKANPRLCFVAIPCAYPALGPSANIDFETVCYIMRDILYVEMRVIVH